MFLYALKDAFYTLLLTLLIIGPILSLVIQGFAIDFKFERLWWLGICVFFGRFFYLIIRGSPTGKQVLSTIARMTTPIIAVEKFNHQNWRIACIIVGLLLPLFVSKYWLTVIILAYIYVLLGLGLNIVVGLAGLLNLGFVAFYAIGAYGYALGAEYLHIGFWAALPLCAILAAFMGTLLAFPVLKMHGDYLAIVTLGFGEIIRLILVNWGSFTHGPNGLYVPPPSLFGLEFTHQATQGGRPFHDVFHLNYDTSYKYIFIYFILFFAVLCIYHFVRRLQYMPLGRAWEALREDEVACRSLGINHVTTKLSAFGLGAMIGGIAGVFFAGFESFVNPESFTFIESALILSIAVLGGMGSAPGVVIAAILLTLLPEIFREFANYRMFIFGLTMVLMMIVRPRGLVKIQRQRYDRS